MNNIFWIIMVVIDVFFVLFALARAGITNESAEKKIQLEQSISNVSNVFVYPLLAIGILISTISALIAIWE